MEANKWSNIGEINELAVKMSSQGVIVLVEYARTLE